MREVKVKGEKHFLECREKIGLKKKKKKKSPRGRG